MKKRFALSDAVEAFACFDKPSSYIQEDLYEPERLDYEEMLEGKSREFLAVTNFGTTAWGPLCYLRPEAMGYLLPRLMELATPEAVDKSGSLFMMNLINHFSFGPSGSEYALLNANQRSVVAGFLEHLGNEHGELVTQECWDDVLAEGIRNWRGATNGADEAGSR